MNRVSPPHAQNPNCRRKTAEVVTEENRRASGTAQFMSLRVNHTLVLLGDVECGPSCLLRKMQKA